MLGQICGADGRVAQDVGRQGMSVLLCPLITALVVCLLVFEFASAVAGGSTIGGLILTGLAAYCIYRCYQNGQKGKGCCNPC